MHKIATLASLLLVALFVTSVAFAQTVSTAIPDASNPNMERFCDPKSNAEVMAKIQAYENQITALKDPKSPEKIELMGKIDTQIHKLKCSYRPIQN
ncbi:MAG: hypothetical protein V4525_08015 [Pseudomonadota bacterium]